MNSSCVNTLVIRTPEGIDFSLPLACPVTRCLSWAIDFGCVLALVILVKAVLNIFSLVSLDLGRTLGIIGYFVVQVGYGIFCEWVWRGQTVGKRLLRLRVMDAQGLHLQFNQVVLRNLLRFVDCLPAFYFLGGLVSVLNVRGQRLGDLVAGTIVVRLLRIPEPDIDQLLAGKYNSLRDYPHLEARLRQRISPGEASLALQALLRRDELDLQARVDLFEQMASHFRSLVIFPPEAYEGIAPEQYVRNVVDILFRPRVGRGA